MLVYDKIDPKNIELGQQKKFTNEEDKFITPIFYEGGDFDFSLKNKYVIINCIEENSYGKEYITIKSKEYSEIINSIANKLDCISPVQLNGTFRAHINSKSKISEDIEKIRNSSFKACVSLNFPTIYGDKDKKTLQIYIKNMVVIKIVEGLEINYDELREAL